MANEQTSVQHGISVDEYGDFIDWMGDNPQEATIEFRATGDAEEAANRTSATIGEWSLGGEEMGQSREYTLEFGLPEELEGAMGFVESTDRYEAIEGALAGLTACINGTIAFNAVREGIDVDDIHTTVRVPVDLRVLFGIHGPDRADEMFGDLEIDVEVTGENLSESDVSRIESYPYRSPVYNLLTLSHPSDPDVSVEQS
jgi:hypothetical protein